MFEPTNQGISFFSPNERPGAKTWGLAFPKATLSRVPVLQVWQF